MAKQKSKNTASQIKWGESYTSLFLGIIVVIILAVLIFWFIKGNNGNEMTQSNFTTEDEIAKPTTYVVKEGDHLWSISEKMYGSGYNWVDIVSENKLENPDSLYVGTKLTIPDVKPIKITEAQTIGDGSINEDTYKVVEGDCLWDISLRAYGDAYKWTELAKTNEIVNPDIINVGDTIKIPR